MYSMYVSRESQRTGSFVTHVIMAASIIIHMQQLHSILTTRALLGGGRGGREGGITRMEYHITYAHTHTHTHTHTHYCHRVTPYMQPHTSQHIDTHTRMYT